VTSAILSSLFVNSSTTLTELAQNAAGNFAGCVEQTTLTAHLRPNEQFSTITYIDSGGDSYYQAFQLTVHAAHQRTSLRPGVLTETEQVD